MPDFAGGIDRFNRSERLPEVLPQLSLKAHTTLLMQYGQDASYQEIADALGISTHTVKKYHSQSLAFLSRRMSRLK